MRILLLSCFAACLVSGSVQAQEVDARGELASRLVDVSQGAKMTQQIQDMVRQELDDLSGMPEAEAVWMRANAPRMAIRMVDDILERLTAVYAETYTEQELRAQIAFFETPEGRTIADKGVALGQRQAAIIGEAQVGYITELMSKYCAQFSCPDDVAKAF